MNEKFVCNMKECDLEDLRSDVKDIKNALLGDEFNKNGLVQRVEKVEQKLSLHEKYIGYVIGGGAVIIFITQLVTGCK